MNCEFVNTQSDLFAQENDIFNVPFISLSDTEDVTPFNNEFSLFSEEKEIEVPEYSEDVDLFMPAIGTKSKNQI